MLLHHVALIVSSEKSIEFYKRLGFTVTSRTKRPTDELVYMEMEGTVLEIFVDGTHPPRVDRPEALGLRHIAFQVSDFDAEIEKLQWANMEPVRIDGMGKRFTFFKDPDGLPIEIKETKE